MNTTSTLSFANTHFFVGIDTHLKNWRVTIRNGGIELKTFSMNPSPLELIAYLRKHYPGGIYHLVYEAGFCGFWPQRIFQQHHIDCIVANPADVPTTNKEKVNKSDPIDSKKLARELENKSLHGIYIPSIEHEELRMLMRLRYRVIQSQTRTKNRIKSLLYSQGIAIPIQFSGSARWSHHFICWLEALPMNTTAGRFTSLNLIAQLREIRQHNKNVLKQLRLEARKETIAPIINTLMSVPGVAFITAMTLYAELIDMKRFTDENHLASFIGLVPSVQSSDDTIYSNNITVRKHSFLRVVMIESAWTAVREDPAMTLKYNELTQRMNGKNAIVRIARKLIRRIRHVWLHQQDYQYALVA
ncbi:MAG: IS110 family transposase [Ignavibacteriales bacterium]|nr:IS110 family transposase [Ignavibacteriales bacterium]